MNSLALPDVASQTRAHLDIALEWGGMQNIALPVVLADQRIAAFADAGVSLDDPATRGIHMSRLYLALECLEDRPLTPGLLKHVLGHFLATHAGLSKRAFLAVRGELLLKRPALARQVIQQRFAEDFAGRPLQRAELLAWLGSERGIAATPHSQRSVASLRIRLAADQGELPLLALLDTAEDSLATPVQTAVKRDDEQAFALANGQNPMFCEDAARRLHWTLTEFSGIQAFHLRVVHAESLHAHDAVAQSAWNWSQECC